MTANVKDHSSETERRLSGGRLCAGCGTSLEGRRPQAKFCTDACRARTKREARLRHWLVLRKELDAMFGVGREDFVGDETVTSRLTDIRVTKT